MNTNKYQSKPFNTGLPPQSPAPNTLFMNLDYLKDISEGNTAFIGLMLDAFKGEATEFLQSFESQLNSSDFTSMEKTAHKMKPTGAYIGANSLTMMIRNLEQAVKQTNRIEIQTLFSQVQNMVTSILKEIDLYRSK